MTQAKQQVNSTPLGYTRLNKEDALRELEACRARLGIGPDDCVMCALVQRNPRDVVFETSLAQVRLDRWGCTEGHLLVIPRHHAEHTSDLSWELYSHLHQLAHQACGVLRRELDPLRVFVASLGSPRPLAQSYPHVHLHIIPIYVDDERARPAFVLSWSSGVTTYSDEQAAAFVSRLAFAWPKQPQESDMSHLVPVRPASPASKPVSAHLASDRPRRARFSRLQHIAAAAASLIAAGACSSAYRFPDDEEGQTPTVTPSPQPTNPSITLDSADSTFDSDPELVEVMRGLHPTLGQAKDDNPARPIVTGTLLVTADGKSAFASDADRDVVFQVALPERTVKRFELAAGEQPGQLVEVPRQEGGSRVFAALRAGGAVLSIDPQLGETARFEVCAAPRGLTYEPLADRVYVACQSGELVTLNPTDGAVERVVQVAPDLRDVQVVGGELLVTRYRSAQVLELDDQGGIQSTRSPNTMPGCAEPAVMFRLVTRGGTLYVAHQMDTTATLETSPGGYESGSGCTAAPIEPTLVVGDADELVQRSPTAGEPELRVVHAPLGQFPDGDIIDGSGPTGIGLTKRAGPVDIAVSASGRVGMTFTGDSLWPEVKALVTFTPPTSNDTWAGFRYNEHATSGTVTAVAFDGNEHWIVQSREPAQLAFEDGAILSLDAKSAANSGLDLFYVNTGGGLSCAGCHPEGDEDGRTWAFPQGLRRTQPLGGGVMSRTPFHWDGEMPTMDKLVNEVMLGRMSFHTPLDAKQIDLLGSWLDSIPAPAPLLGVSGTNLPSADAVERGRALFFDEAVACGTCHSGPAYSDNLAYDVGTGGTFFTPTLLGIGLRDQVMHDGCAKTLHERFGVCGGTAHGVTAHLDAGQIDDLVAFMQSL